MNIKICDKCKEQFGTFPMQAVRFPVVSVRVIRNYACEVYDGKWSSIDLCPKCQHEVYEFIFGEVQNDARNSVQSESCKTRT